MKNVLTILFIVIANLVYGQKSTDIVIRDKVNADLLEKLMLDEINVYRKSKGLQPLMLDSNLFKQSRKHSEWMDSNKKLQHTVGGNYFSECIFNAGYSNGYSYAVNAKNLIRVWIQSPGHNAILLDSRANTGGVGIKIQSNSYNGIYATLQLSHIMTKEELDGIPQYTRDGKLIKK